MIFGKPSIKLGLAILILFEIISLFYFIHLYNKIANNSNNYYKNILTTDITRTNINDPDKTQ